MAVTVNAGSAGIDIVAHNANADVTVGSRSVFFHLTQGFSLAGSEGLNQQPGPALSAIGHVKVATSGPDALKGWNFGFVQLTKMHFGAAYYAGRMRKEGAVAVTFKNAMPADLLLDSKDSHSPWTVPGPQFQLVGNEINCSTMDHPALKVPRTVNNSARINITNFLFHVIDRREFWSVLTAVAPDGKRQHLAHFHWRVDHNVMFKWVAGNPVPASKACSFQLLGKAAGAPADAELQGLLGNPVAPQFNDAAEKALLQAFLGGRGDNRSELPNWFNNVPDSFYA